VDNWTEDAAPFLFFFEEKYVINMKPGNAQLASDEKQQAAQH
jgi:hypothetical protein